MLRLRAGSSHDSPADIGTPRSIVDRPLIPDPSATGRPTANCLTGPGAAHPHVASPQAWFCQRLLDGRGPAQVGLDPGTQGSHRLRLSPLAITTHAAGKGEAGKASHSLPVVAVGSIPHIYQRATFSPLGDPEADATKPHYLGRIDT